MTAETQSTGPLFTVAQIENGYLLIRSSTEEATYFATENALGKGLTEMVKELRAEHSSLMGN